MRTRLPWVRRSTANRSASTAIRSVTWAILEGTRCRTTRWRATRQGATRSVQARVEVTEASAPSLSAPSGVGPGVWVQAHWVTTRGPAGWTRTPSTGARASASLPRAHASTGLNSATHPASADTDRRTATRSLRQELKIIQSKCLILLLQLGQFMKIKEKFLEDHLENKSFF